MASKNSDKMLSIDDLRGIMRACLGSDGVANIDREDLLDCSFEDLDFDSLAKVELAERLRDLYDIDLSDDELDRLNGPRDMLSHLGMRST